MEETAEDEDENKIENEREELLDIPQVKLEIPIIELEKEEIKAQNKIKKKKVKQIKIKRPLRLQRLFVSQSYWTFSFTLYYIWNFLLMIIGLGLIWICIYLHLYLIKLWPNIEGNIKDEEVEEEGAVVLFCATIIPIISNGIIEFIGIPYASLPLGNSHFYKPGPLVSFIDCYKSYWEDMNPKQRIFQNGRIKFFSIAKYEHCKQIFPDKSHILGINSCLTISIKSVFKRINKKFQIFYKKHTETLFPVVVYLTGRTYLENRPFLVCDSIVKRTKAVYIIINYRLNILGFSNFNLMKSPRNIGYIDFLAAMEFIFKYISKFGGNKSSITLLAEESGATTALINMVMKKSRNLFSKMWLMDGSTFIPNRPARSLFYDLYSSKNILCQKYLIIEDIFKCLQNFSSNTLLNNSPKGWLTANNYFYYLPNLFEERQSIIEKEENVVDNPLEIVMNVGSEIVDIPIVIMSKIDYVPYWENLYFSINIGKLTRKELYSKTRMGLRNYQTSVSQTVLHNDVNLAYKDYIKFIENRSIFNQYVDKDIIPLGFEEVFKAIISDVRSTCPFSSFAKYLQINAHIVKGPMYRIIDGGNRFLEHSKESKFPCDLHYFLQDNSVKCISSTKNMPSEYRESIVQSFTDFVNNGKINNAIQMEYPQNSKMKEFEDTFNFVGRLGFKTAGVRETGMLQLCNIWKTGTNEYPMLKTSSKVN